MLIDISRLSQEKTFVFIHRFAKCIDEALDSLNIRRESMKLMIKEEQERAIKEYDFGVN